MVATRLRRAFGFAWIIMALTFGSNLDASAGFLVIDRERIGDSLAFRLSVIFEGTDDANPTLSRIENCGNSLGSLEQIDFTRLPVNPSLVDESENKDVTLTSPLRDWVPSLMTLEETFLEPQELARLAFEWKQGRPLGWWILPTDPDQNSVIDRVASPQSIVMLGTGLILIAGARSGGRKIRRFVRFVNRSRGRRSIDRYFY
jgi:hypothetical protein